jgi:hypothetical protein
MNPVKMKKFFDSVVSINRDLKKLISQEAINNFGKTSYQGDNANYSISVFQDHLIQPNENIKKFLYYMGKSLITWSKSNFKDGYYAIRGLHHASRKLKIASALLRLGYEHADSGKLLSSIVSGHGRNWGIGAVTGCYSPLLVGTDENLGNYNYILKFQSETISKGCLPLVRHTEENKIEIKIYNVTNNDNSLKFSYKGLKSEEVKVSAGSIYETIFS